MLKNSFNPPKKNNLSKDYVCHDTFEKVLIIGADSHLGIALKNRLSYKKINVFGTTRRKRNINHNTYLLDLEKTDFEIPIQKYTSAIFCAATTNIAECEKDPHKHKKINVTNTLKLIEKLVANNIFVIYLSSNSVFNGEKEFYKYDEKTSPNNKYGKFKTEVEEYLINKLASKSCILRLTKVITKETPFIQNWNNEANQGKPIKTFINKFLSPVGIEDALDAIELLIKCKQSGIYQLGGRKEFSYTEYAKHIYKDFPKVLALISELVYLDSEKRFIHNSLSTNMHKRRSNL